MKAERSSEMKALLADIERQRRLDPVTLNETARAASQANAAELQSNREVLSRLQDIVSDRIGTAVQHVTSEPVLKGAPVAGRTIVQQLAYTKHWFEVSDPSGKKPHRLVGADRQICVFVKSGYGVRVQSKLERLLSERAYRRFRTPYFFGDFTLDGRQIAAWESVEVTRCGFRKYSFEDQRRIVASIAELNCVDAAGAAPIGTKWIGVRPAWFEARYRKAVSGPDQQWKDLYGRTVDVLKHRDAMSRRLRSVGETFLTHNDVGLGASNISVQPDGEVIYFDWDIATLSVPGADLAILSHLETGERLMSYYIERMAEHGVKLELDQVRFTANIVRGFRLLQSGWRSLSPPTVEFALDLLMRHVDRKPAQANGKPAQVNGKPGWLARLFRTPAPAPAPDVPGSAPGASSAGIAPLPSAPSRALNSPSPELVANINEYLRARGTRPYQPILHPAFSHLGYQNGPERFDSIILPHLAYRNGTVLDIGSNWGYMAHRLEDLGYQVTAVEVSKKNAYFLEELRDLSGKQFRIVRDSIFNLEEPNYDIVFALNIFHHFLKREETFLQLESFLERLKCRMLIYQCHEPSERQMIGAYRNMTPEDATQFLSEKLSLPRIVQIGSYRRGRRIFKLTEA